jgi:AcrR family transcriptional regulator
LFKQKLSDLKQSERDARRKLILDSACSLFSKKDFRKVNVREIAAEAGVSVGTIYNYYADLDELFLDVFLKNAEEIICLLEKEGSNGFPSLEKLCETYITYLNQNMTFYQMMGHFMLGGKLSEEATVKLNQMMRILMDSIELILKAHEGVHGDTRSLSHALFSALNGIMISYAGYPGRDIEKVETYTRKLGGIVADIFKAKLKG